MVAAEVEYLAAQLGQLPLMQQALEESEAMGHTCFLDHCPTCGGSGGEAEQQELQAAQRGAAGAEEQAEAALAAQAV